MCLVAWVEQYPRTRVLGIVHLIIAILSLILGIQGYACVLEILELFGVKNERYKGAGWMLSLMLNVLEMVAASCLIRSSAKTSQPWNTTPLQYCVYWLSISTLLLAAHSLQFFFSFRSSLPVILFNMGHVTFLGLAILLIRDYMNNDVLHLDKGYTAVSIHIPSGSSFNSFDSRSITPSVRTPADPMPPPGVPQFV